MHCLLSEINVASSQFVVESSDTGIEGELSSEIINDLIAASVEVGTDYGINFPMGNSDILLHITNVEEQTTLGLVFDINTGRYETKRSIIINP